MNSNGGGGKPKASLPLGGDSQDRPRDGRAVLSDAQKLRAKAFREARREKERRSSALSQARARLEVEGTPGDVELLDEFLKAYLSDTVESQRHSE